jgi:hypothetical protein
MSRLSIAITLQLAWHWMLSWRPRLRTKLPKFDHERAARIAEMRWAKFR